MQGIKSTVPEEEPSRISIHEYWKIFWKKKYYIILPIVLAAGISYFGVKFLTPIYESKALLSIEEKSVLSQTVGKYISSVEERSRLRNRQYRAMIETKIKSKPFLELVRNVLAAVFSKIIIDWFKYLYQKWKDGKSKTPVVISSIHF